MHNACRLRLPRIWNPSLTSRSDFATSRSDVFYGLLKMICYGFVQPCSFGRSQFQNLSTRCHQRLLHAIQTFLCSFEYCHLLELYVKCAALYRTLIPQSFIGGNNTHGPVAGRVWGWSSARGRTNRKHCPSHEIWSDKKDGC